MFQSVKTQQSDCIKYNTLLGKSYGFSDPCNSLCCCQHKSLWADKKTGTGLLCKKALPLRRRWICAFCRYATLRFNSSRKVIENHCYARKELSIPSIIPANARRPGKQKQSKAKQSKGKYWTMASSSRNRCRRLFICRTRSSLTPACPLHQP